MTDTANAHCHLEKRSLPVRVLQRVVKGEPGFGPGALPSPRTEQVDALFSQEQAETTPTGEGRQDVDASAEPESGERWTRCAGYGLENLFYRARRALSRFATASANELPNSRCIMNTICTQISS